MNPPTLTLSDYLYTVLSCTQLKCVSMCGSEGTPVAAGVGGGEI